MNRFKRKIEFIRRAPGRGGRWHLPGEVVVYPRAVAHGFISRGEAVYYKEPEGAPEEVVEAGHPDSGSEDDEVDHQGLVCEKCGREYKPQSERFYRAHVEKCSG